MLKTKVVFGCLNLDAEKKTSYVNHNVNRTHAVTVFFAPLGEIKETQRSHQAHRCKAFLLISSMGFKLLSPQCDNYHNRLLYIYVTIFFIFKYAVIFVLYIAVVENANCTFYV